MLMPLLLTRWPAAGPPGKETRCEEGHMESLLAAKVEEASEPCAWHGRHARGGPVSRGEIEWHSKHARGS